MIGKPLCAIVALVAVAAATPGPAAAQDLPRAQFKVIGGSSSSPHFKFNQLPFWTETLTRASNGQVTADITPLDQLGIDDKTMLRIMRLGLTDFANFDVSKMAGDDPRFEGCDLAGIALDIRKARAACQAYLPVMDKIMQEAWNTKILALTTSPPQVIWCRVPIDGLADLRGKKIRVFNPSMRDFLAGVGAESISLSFAEVLPALQRGVVDCAVTGNLTGNIAGWPEVTTHVFPMYMGWSIGVEVVNVNVWKRMDPKLQAFFLAEMPKYETKYWAYMEAATNEADACNYSRGACTMAKPVKLTEVPIKAADAAQHKQLIETVVVRNWVKRAGPNSIKEWNDTVGKALGYTASAN
ncbi:MAG: TRAP transporter substrate-binding protein [Alphaproteobacteria bacterium]|nr:TRAP transporter substrate-binding protein [Alphaproteobacteria bacterium]